MRQAFKAPIGERLMANAPPPGDPLLGPSERIEDPFGARTNADLLDDHVLAHRCVST
jgi:hypothetical protein